MNCPKELETERWNICNYAKFYEELMGALLSVAKKTYIVWKPVRYST